MTVGYSSVLAGRANTINRHLIYERQARKIKEALTETLRIDCDAHL